jgi:hypothetical protein
MVDSRVMACAVRGEEGSERCLPAWTRRREVAGRFVRRARRECRVATVVDLGMVMGKAGGVLVLGWVVLGGGSEVLTVAGEVLYEDLHGLFGLGGWCTGGVGGDAGDAVGAHDGG